MKYLIVGLGNLEKAYAFTRHNIGFRMLEGLAERSAATFSLQRYGLLAKTTYKGRSLLLLKPNTYMNASGKAVRYYLTKEKIPKARLLVLVDDVALPFGRLRLRGKGSAGGHNGLQDVNERLESEQYARLRFGIGGGFIKGKQVDYVLSPFTKEEETALSLPLQQAVDMIRSFCTLGVERTANNHHYTGGNIPNDA